MSDRVSKRKDFKTIEKYCAFCGKTGKLDIHHIDENPNNNNLENLMCLCRSCHMKAHRSKEVMHNE